MKRPPNQTTLWLMVLLLLALAPFVRPTSAQPGADALPVVRDTPEGVRITWNGAVVPDRAGAATIPGWQQLTVGTQSVPAHLVTVRLAPGATVAPRVVRLARAPWSGTVAAAPRADAGAVPAGRATVAAPPSVAMPGAPVTLLRLGTARGTRVVVVAITPVYATGDGMQAARALDVLLPGAVLHDPNTMTASSAPFAPSAVVPTPNPAADRAGWVVRVERAGIQTIPMATLRGLGLSATVDPRTLHLRWHGIVVPLEERRAANGTLDALVFYAPAPGDRWNSSAAYWLSVEATAGARIGQRAVAPGSAPARTTAIAFGTIKGTQRYDSTLPGADGDHWFGADLRAIPRETPASVSVPLSPTLPLARGTTTITLALTGYTPGEHALRVGVGGSSADVAWGGAGDQSYTVALDATAATVVLMPLVGGAISGMLLDQLTWRAPATLDFAGRGAFFDGVDGRWRYQLSRTPTARALYDITNPRAPQRLGLPDGQTTSFEDGPGARRYLLAGPGTTWTPAVEARAAVDLARALDADAVYIAPAVLHAALAPLLDLRRAQGHRVALVDTAAIYDTWNWGEVAPDAIRHFLQYAVARWNVAPTAVALVGDGTSDPHDYLGFGQRNLVPPFLQMVDPWMGETACEPCFGQLDGASPLDDALPDVAVGRIPVGGADELRQVVAKLVAYETAASDARWQRRAVVLADNYREANGRADSAGDFATVAEGVVADLPAGVEATRVYYDPYAPTSGVPGHEPNATRARERTIAALRAGAGIVTYIGHAHYYQLAVTELPQSLFGLYDVDVLHNAPRLPIMLQMTCLTSAFFQPNFSGMTIDERLVRFPSGGAAAVWGPTGLGLAYGHDQLLQGFMRELWDRDGARPTMGELTTAGFLELYSHGTCCQESLRTYALLGDPLTVAQAAPGFSAYAPLVRR